MLKTIFDKIFNSIKTNRVLSLFFWSIMLLFILQLLYKHSPISFLFSVSYKELIAWYPTFYIFIFLILKIIIILAYILIGLQLSVVVFNKQVHVVIKFFLIVSCLFIYSYLPDSFWILSAQSMLVWSYYNISLNIKPSNNYIKTDKWIVFGVILVALSLRIIWILNTDNSGNGDAAMRISEIKRWVTLSESVGFNNGIKNVYFIMPSKDWLPLHYYLVGFVGKITSEWVYSPRFLSAIIGALTIIPLFMLSYLKFSKQTAFISIIIFSLYGYHIFLSSLVLSEVFYVFFVIWSYYLIERWVVSNRDSKLISLAIILGCLCLLRYEGWFISLLIIFILPFIKTIKSWRLYVMFIFIVLVPPVFVMICEMAYGFHPLYGILFSNLEVKESLSKNPDSFLEILMRFKYAFIPLVFISFLALGFTFTKHKNIKLVLLWLLYILPLFPFIFKLANGTLTSQGRYLTLYMIPLIPFLAFHFAKLFEVVPKWQFVVLFSAFLVLLNLPFYDQVKNQQLLLKYSHGFHESASFAKQLKHGQFYLDNEIQWGELNWDVEADVSSIYKIEQLNQIFFRKIIYNDNLGDLFIKNVIGTVEFDKGYSDKWTSENFDTLLFEGLISHILLIPNGELSKKLKFSKIEENYLDINFCKLFEKDNYFIYKVERNYLDK